MTWWRTVLNVDTCISGVNLRRLHLAVLKFANLTSTILVTTIDLPSSSCRVGYIITIHTKSLCSDGSHTRPDVDNHIPTGPTSITC